MHQRFQTEEYSTGPVSRPPHYDSATIWFHWLTAAIVVGQWVGAKTLDMWPRGALRVDVRSLHIAFGILLALLLIARIGWRATRGKQLPSAEGGILGMLAKAVHWGLYALLIGTLALGLTLMSLRGDSFFGLFVLPAWSFSTASLRHSIQDLHDLFATTLLVVAGLHASAALMHRYVLKDDVLARMIPQHR